MTELVKDAIDVGVVTTDWPAWEEALSGRARYDHLLKVGGGVHQHRYDAGGSVLKVNSTRHRVPRAPTALDGLRVVGDTVESWDWVSPEGVPISIVPDGTDGITSIEVMWRTPDPDAVAAFLADGFGAEVLGNGSIAIGRSFLVVVEGPEPAPVDDPMAGAGIRYLTVQIRDVRVEHARLLELGATQGRPPIRLGDTAFISFVRAPDGTWIELSQRASLTGPLPDDAPRA